MRFLVGFALLYFLGFAKARAEPNPLLTGLTSVVPGNPLLGPSCGVPGIPLLGCVYLEAVTIFITAVCKVFEIAEDVSEFLACLIADLDPPFASLLTSIFNGIMLASDTLTSICPINIDYANSVLADICPGLVLDLNKTLQLVLGSNDGPSAPTAVKCGSPPFKLLACLIVEYYLVIIRLLCVVNSIGIKAVTILSCLGIDPVLGGLISSITNGLYIGMKAVRSICLKTVSTWTTFIDSSCAGIVKETNNLFAGLLPVFK